MNLIHEPREEPDPGDMRPAFDPDAETGARADSPAFGEEKADAITGSPE